MEKSQAYITLTIDLVEPIELADFADLFASLGSQFDSYLKKNHPDIHGEARFFVKEVRSGSIIADIVPMMAMLVDLMDKTVIVSQFSEWLSHRVGVYLRGGRLPEAKKSDIAEITDIVKAVAKNAGGESKIESIRFIDGKAQKALELQFDTTQAKRAVEALEAHKADLDKKQAADHQNVLMVFFQANLKPADIGKKSGEQVIIEKIDPKQKPLVYASDLAKDRIKSEFGDAIFKKGFFVDVNVETLQNRIVAYKVTNVHDIIDLPDD